MSPQSTKVSTSFGGDFNEVLCTSELEGVSNVERMSMNEFRDVVDMMQLRDLGYSGSWYTWERGRNPALENANELIDF